MGGLQSFPEPTGFDYFEELEVVGYEMSTLGGSSGMGIYQKKDGRYVFKGSHKGFVEKVNGRWYNKNYSVLPNPAMLTYFPQRQVPN